jgi:hypothetical protein
MDVVPWGALVDIGGAPEVVAGGPFVGSLASSPLEQAVSVVTTTVAAARARDARTSRGMRRG